MAWLGLVYSLPGNSVSSRRVALWRRLQKLGAVSPTGSLYLLPPGDEHLEAFTWLAQEINEGGGEAMVASISGFGADGEARAVAAFRAARAEDYAALAAEAEKLGAEPPEAEGERPALREAVERLRRRLAEVARIDYFPPAEAGRAQAAFAALERRLASGSAPASPAAPALDPADFRERRWMTRPRPFVDRLACAWFIRRFLDPEARIRYGEAPRGREIPFDTQGAEFGHHGSRCSFETMVAAFGLEGDGALAALGQIVHQVDLADGLYDRPEALGVAEILRGWTAAGWSDADLERSGVPLFEGLYTALGGGAATRRPRKR